MDRESSIAEFDMMQETFASNNNGDEKTKSVHGKALKELEQFFIKHDPKSDFAGLHRVVAPDGSMMWCLPEEASELGKAAAKPASGSDVTSQSAFDVQERADWLDEIDSLRQRNKELEMLAKNSSPSPTNPPDPPAVKGGDDG